MADNTTVADCSASQYCTKTGLPLDYQSPFVVYWNNKFPPLNPESLVTIRVYSEFDTKNWIYQVGGLSNTNGMTTLDPQADWYAKYTGTDAAGGMNQKIYFAVYLQGNDPPAVSDMLQLQLTATPAQYRDIQDKLHPSPTSSVVAATALSSSYQASASSAAPAASSASGSVSGTKETATASGASSIQATSTKDGASQSNSSSKQTSSSGHKTLSTEASNSLDVSATGGYPTSTSTIEPSSSSHGRKSLSTGAIVGIVLGSVAALLIILLVLVPLYRRRSRKKRALSKSAALAAASGGPSPGGDGAALAAAAAAGGGALAAGVLNEKNKSPSDTPLLTFTGRPNNSFTSHEEGSLSESHLSPNIGGAYQPLSLDSPRVLMNVPRSTRSSRDSTNIEPPARAVRKAALATDPILSTDDARQIGDIFRDALRKPPPVSEDGTSDSPGNRESMVLRDMDDDLEEEELDPGWRERVASERMQRELEQEASVIRSVAMKAHGSDYSSSRPETAQSAHSHPLQSPAEADSSNTQQH
ncbi:hypothetical protein GQ54DRAFT_302644 [Martensiomyces pterosporus]|nr:hypothetical protein GQ54DRAFT_302644 [Martensiomyces pterosporus]